MEELEKLQEIITIHTLQLEESEQKNKHLTENLKGIYNVMSAFCLLVLLGLRSGVLEVRELLKGSHPQLSLKLGETLTYKRKFSSMQTIKNHLSYSMMT